MYTKLPNNNNSLKIINVGLYFVFVVAGAVDDVVVVVVFFYCLWLVCFVLISLLVPYISNVPLYRCNVVLYISPRPYKHSQVYVKLSVISSFYLKVRGG